MTQNKLRVVFIVSVLAVAAVIAVGFSASAATKVADYKEYRSGSAVAIAGQTYLLATNNSSVEIMRFDQASKLVPVSEIRLPQKIRDLVTVNEGKEAYAIVTTGRYLYRIRITDPRRLEVVLRHDNYQYSRNRIRTGSIESLATNGKVLLTSGQFGVRAMGLTNLQVEKYYFLEKSYGVAVNNEVVYVQGEQKAYAFNLATGNKIMEADIKNAEKLNRRSAVNKANAGFIVSDNALLRMANGKVTTYVNPTPKVNYSYAATATDKAVYYVNGFGITKFDNNLKKTAFIKTSVSSRFGDRSFAVGVLAVNVNGGEKIVVMNKSSILVMSPNLSLISQYKDANNLQSTPEVSVTFDHQYFMTNQAITARMSGYWPNELVKLTIGGRTYQVKANNIGDAMISFMTPGTPARYMLDVTALSSGINYQIVRDVR
jgi:hypothetical protein